MAAEKIKAKGGFRSTLALMISIVALILSMVAYNRTGGEADLKAEITALQTRIKTLTKDTSEQMKKVREETGRAIEKIGQAIKKESEPASN